MRTNKFCTTALSRWVLTPCPPNLIRRASLAIWLSAAIGALAPGNALAQQASTQAKESSAQADGPCPSGVYLMGRDTPWVPTPDTLVQAMLDLVELTPQDYVIDLGSGDGRMVIAAAQRGASGHGVEYNPIMVECANWRARQAGVTDKARFIQGDMFTADISEATVLPLFLLDENLHQLMPTFLNLRPGTRIATNDYAIPGWDAVKSLTLSGNCGHWCTAHLWIVPARISGTWNLDGVGELTLDQSAQQISGTLSSSNGSQKVIGQVHGDKVTFQAGDIEYTGTVNGNVMTGQSASHTWSATRKSS